MRDAMKTALADTLWRLGTLAELPRDMHCGHPQPSDSEPRPATVPCPECRQVLEVLDALRNERPS
jgi:hypothetical protein